MKRNLFNRDIAGTARKGRLIPNIIFQIGKVFCLSLLFSLVATTSSHAQQWKGSPNEHGIIYRYGAVGIGTSSPETKLEVKGDLSINLLHRREKLLLHKLANTTPQYSSHVIGTENYYLTYGPGKFYPNSNGHKFYVQGQTMAAQIGFGGPGQPFNKLNSFFNGKVGIGTQNPEAQLHVNGDILLTNHRALSFKDKDGKYSPVLRLNQWNGLTLWNIYGNDISFGTGPESHANIRMSIKGNGNVGIGTPNPGYRLTVNGTIRANQIIVDTGGADFVFEDGYYLRPLDEVESYIKANGHLPDIPPASNVKTNGLRLGEMQTKLLQKIEELTLYVIDLKKENKELVDRLSSLEKK